VSPRLSEHWLDGRLVSPGDPCPADERGGALARGCYTTARVRAGVARHAAGHAKRLARDARALGIGEVPAEAVAELFETLGRHAFGAGEGVIRVEARRSAHEEASLRGVPRALGPDRMAWTACTAPFLHGGPGPCPGAKRLGDPVYERARHLAQRDGVDEVLLLDGTGRLVEGARSNLVVVDEAGHLWTPEPSLGAVAGIALAAVREQVRELTTREIRSDELAGLREIIAVNAVRGARAVVRLDGRRVGSGKPGTWARQLDALLAQA
jgi:branched-chain amino acid aminotransferase